MGGPDLMRFLSGLAALGPNVTAVTTAPTPVVTPQNGPSPLCGGPAVTAVTAQNNQPLKRAVLPALGETPETPPATQGVSPEIRVFPLYSGPAETPETPETPQNNQSGWRSRARAPATLTHAQRQTVTRWLVRIGCSPAEIAQTLRDCEADPQALAHCLRRAADPAWLFGGREEPAPAPPPATVQACANCQHCRPAAMKPEGRFEREARYWCSQPDRPTPGLIPARRGHGCTGWTARMRGQQAHPHQPQPQKEAP